MSGRYNSCAVANLDLSPEHQSSSSGAGDGDGFEVVRRKKGDNKKKNGSSRYDNNDRNRKAFEDTAPDWVRISSQIRAFSLSLPQLSSTEEGVLYLTQGRDFYYCDQFLDTILYGADFYNGLILKNFSSFPDNFFSLFFKHLVKTSFPQKIIPLLNFRLTFSFPWPHSNHLRELPRHLEPKLIRKKEFPLSAEQYNGFHNFPNNNNAVSNPIRRMDNGQPKGTNQRVMYLLRNEATGANFYIKLWFDPTKGDRRYENINGLTMRKEGVV